MAFHRTTIGVCLFAAYLAQATLACMKTVPGPTPGIPAGASKCNDCVESQITKTMQGVPMWMTSISGTGSPCATLQVICGGGPNAIYRDDVVMIGSGVVELECNAAGAWMFNNVLITKLLCSSPLG